MSSGSQSINLTFDLAGDEFPHAWFFNRFRVDKLGNSTLLTLALATENGAVISTNAIVMSETDLRHSRERSIKYLEELHEDAGVIANPILGYSSPPERVYPVNHFNLARIDGVSEMGFYRFSLQTLANNVSKNQAKPTGHPTAVKCYPVVMFRCDLEVQLILIKEVFSR